MSILVFIHVLSNDDLGHPLIKVKLHLHSLDIDFLRKGFIEDLCTFILRFCPCLVSIVVQLFGDFGVLLCLIHRDLVVLFVDVDELRSELGHLVVNRVVCRCSLVHDSIVLFHPVLFQ